MLDLVNFLARNLVLHPEAVEVRPNESEQGTTFEVRVHKDDLGRVIGKQGSYVRGPYAPIADSELELIRAALRSVASRPGAEELMPVA